MTLALLAAAWLAGLLVGLRYSAEPLPVFLLALASIPVAILLRIYGRSPGIALVLGLFLLGFWRPQVSGLPELPAQARERYQAQGLEPIAAGLLSRDLDFGGVFEDAVGAGADARTVANWLTGEVTAWLRKESSALADTPLDGAALAELDTMVRAGDLSATAAKGVLAGVLSGEGRPGEVAESRDLRQVSDSASLEPAVDEVLAANEDALEKLKAGDDKVMGFLIGQVMKSTGGKADPATVTTIIKDRAG